MGDVPSAIAFRLRGTKSNRDAIGAAVTVETELGRQTRMLQAGSGFLSQHSKEMFFGLGDAKGPVEVSIRWPSGLVQQLNGLPHDHRIWIEEGAQPLRMEPFLQVRAHSAPSKPQHRQSLPATIEPYLLAHLP